MVERTNENTAERVDAVTSEGTDEGTVKRQTYGRKDGRRDGRTNEKMVEGTDVRRDRGDRRSYQ